MTHDVKDRIIILGMCLEGGTLLWKKRREKVCAEREVASSLVEIQAERCGECYIKSVHVTKKGK